MTTPAAWSEKEIDRFTKRVEMFKRRGTGLDRSEQLAEQLVIRDRELDSRRLCIECAHLQRDGVCFAARQGQLLASPNLTPVRDTLQRCERFAWQKP